MEAHIRFESNGSDYLLVVPFSERDRAKSIEGRRWNPELRCWVYPASARTFDAIIAEFGDELGPHSVLRPRGDVTPRPNAGGEQDLRLKSENARLRDELSSIRQAVDELVKTNRSTDTGAASQAVIAARTEEAARLRAELELAREELQRASNAQYATQRDSAAMARELEATRTKLADATRQKPASGAPDVLNLVKALAKSTASHRDFRLFLDNLPADDSLPIELGKFLERTLRGRLSTYTEASLHELIREGRDSNLLSDEAADFAHLIRKQRNKLAHDGAARVTYRARSALALCAAALFWAEFE